MPSIDVGSTTITYTVEERSRRRYAAIQVDDERRVTVLVPPGYLPEAIAPLLHQHARWLLHQLARPRAPRKEFETGEIFQYLGDPVSLWLESREGGGEVRLTEDRGLHVAVGSDIGGERARLVRDALVDWFSDRALDVLPSRVKHYSKILNTYPTQLKIWEYKSRWGFCRADGLIALNWRIIQAPLAVIDYVVVHELIHRTHPHHQPAFWKAVKRARPTVERDRQWLKDHASELFW